MLLLIFSTSFSQIMKVGYINSPVYANVKNADHPGIALELWELIAKENHWQYKLTNVGSDGDAAINKLENHDYDILIGGISVTKPRLNKVEFSLPFFISSIGLMTTHSNMTISTHLFELLLHLFNFKLLIVALFIVILLHLFWLIARRAGQASRSYFKGIAKCAWLCICLVVPGSLEFKAQDIKLRIISVIIMLFSLFILSMIVATIASAFTASLIVHHQKIINLDDIGDQVVTTTKGSSFVDIARHHGLRITVVDTYQQAVNLLLDKKVVALVTDIPSASYYLKMHPDVDLEISPFRFRYSQQTFAVQKNSPYLQKLNTSLIALQESGVAQSICAKYLRMRDAKLCSL